MTVFGRSAQRFLLTFGCFLTSVSACTVDIGNGSQRAGQRCFQDSDCSESLVCVERICRPVRSGSSPGGDLDMGSPDQSGPDVADSGGPDQPPPPPDMPPPDLPPNCRPGERLCTGPDVAAVCIDTGGGDYQYRQQRCGPEEFCEDGRCLPNTDRCIDPDGDGYGPSCPRGDVDCAPRDRSVNPGVMEVCGNRIDDNCDGRVDETCDGCCPGGCRNLEFCNATCACQPYDPDVCQFQNQPCEQEGDFMNGFICASLDGNSQARCWAICQKDADVPCAEAGSVCAFGDDEQGICLTGCDIQAGCGSEDLGCLPQDIGVAEGVCVPANPDNEIGDRCDEDSFFDCEGGAVCVPGGPNGRARCREACRPFAHLATGLDTDCMEGHCLPFSPEFGICFQDNNFMEGAACAPVQSACNEDAVGCYPGGPQGQQCMRICRLDVGDSDCVAGNTCTQFDPNQTELGVCFSP